MSVMIMGSIVDPSCEVIATFDIKGSLKDRFTNRSESLTYEILNPNIVYKD